MKQSWLLIFAFIFLSLCQAQIHQRYLTTKTEREKDEETKAYVQFLDDLSVDSKGYTTISSNLTNNKCIAKFKTILESLPIEVSNALMEIFTINSSYTDRCCDPSDITDSILTPFSQRINAFLQSMTDKSQQNKAAYACYKNNEAVDARIGIETDSADVASTTQFVNENINSSNQLNSAQIKCSKGLLKVMMKNAGLMCLRNDAADAVFTKNADGSYGMPKKSTEDEEAIAEACGDYIHAVNDHTATTMNSFIDSFNYLLGLEECSYHSNFFNFDPTSDIDDPLFPDQMKTNINSAKSDAFDSLLDKWNTCATKDASLTKVSTLKQAALASRSKFRGGLQTYIGRYDIDFKIIQKTFNSEKYPSYHIHCENQKCQEYCSNCGGLNWERDQVVSTSTTILDVSCCDKICVVLVDIEDNVGGSVSRVSGAEVYKLVSDSEQVEIDKLLINKLENSKKCFETVTGTALNAKVNDSVQKFITTPTNYIIDFRFQAALNLKLNNGTKEVTLLDHIYTDLMPKDGNFSFSCSLGSCKDLCDGCSSTSMSLIKNTNVEDSIKITDPIDTPTRMLKTSRTKSSGGSSGGSSKSSSSSSSSKSSSSSSTSKSSSSISSISSSSKSTSSISSISSSTSKTSTSSLSSSSSSSSSYSSTYKSPSTSTSSSLSSSTSSSTSKTSSISSISTKSTAPVTTTTTSKGSSSLTTSPVTSTSTSKGPSSLTTSSTTSSTKTATSTTLRPTSSLSTTSTSKGGSSLTTSSSSKSTTSSTSSVSKGGSALTTSSPVKTTASTKTITTKTPTGATVTQKVNYSTVSKTSAVKSQYTTTSSGTAKAMSKTFSTTTARKSAATNVSSLTRNNNQSYKTQNNGSLFRPVVIKTSYNKAQFISSRTYRRSYIRSFNYNYSPFGRRIYYRRFRPFYYSYFNYSTYWGTHYSWKRRMFMRRYYRHYYRPIYYNNQDMLQQNEINDSDGTIASEFDDSDWVPTYRRYFDVSAYMETINNNINSININVQCCDLYCITVIDGFNDGEALVDTSGKTRVFIDFNLRNNAYLDADTLSQANKQCLISKAFEAMDLNNTDPNKSKSVDLLKQCNIETNFSSFPVKASCLGYLMDHCKAANFKQVLNKMTAFIPDTTTDKSSKMCEAPQSCLSFDKGSFSTTDATKLADKRQCGKDLLSMYTNGLTNFDYEGLITPCNKNIMTTTANDLSAQDLEGEGARLRNLSSSSNKNTLYGVELKNLAGKNFKRKLTTDEYIDSSKLNADQLSEFNYIKGAAGVALDNAVSEGFQLQIDGSTDTIVNAYGTYEAQQIQTFGNALVTGQSVTGGSFLYLTLLLLLCFMYI